MHFNDPACIPSLRGLLYSLPMMGAVRSDCSVKYLCMLVKCHIIGESSLESCGCHSSVLTFFNLDNNKVSLVQHDGSIN